MSRLLLLNSWLSADTSLIKFSHFVSKTWHRSFASLSSSTLCFISEFSPSIVLLSTSIFNFISVLSLERFCTLLLNSSQSSSDLVSLPSTSRNYLILIWASRFRFVISSFYWAITASLSALTVLSIVTSLVRSVSFSCIYWRVFWDIEKSFKTRLYFDSRSRWALCMLFSFDSNFSRSCTSSSWFLVFCK